MDDLEKHFYDFGPFRLDPSERLLLRGYDVVPLTPKAFEMLLVLVESNGHVLTKDELMKRVWPDTIVEEANLSHNIYRLREALAEGRDGDKYIETLPRRGYRFVAKVTEVHNEGSDLIVAEHVRARVVIEEEPDASSSGLATPEKTIQNSVWPLVVTGTAVALLLMFALGGVILWQRRWAASPSTVRSTPLPMRTTPLTSFPDEELDPSLSPDGKLIAYTWKGGENKGLNVYVQQVDGGTPVRLTSEIARDGCPKWSPDGRYLAFSRGSVDPNKNGIYVIPALGGPERHLLTAWSGKVDWSPDGKYLVFSGRPSAEGSTYLGVLNIDSLEVRQLTHPRPGLQGDFDCSFSPDGQQVAFSRRAESASELFVVRAAGGEPRQLTFDNRRIDTPAWTPDGRELVFASNRDGSYNLWRMPSEGGTPRRLEGIGLDAHQPSIARSGGRLVYSQQSIDTNIWRMQTRASTGDSNSRIKIIGSTRRDENPHLSPDGKKIAFESNRSGSRELWLADADGGNPLQLTNFAGPLTGNPRWSPDGRELAFDSRPEGRAQIYLINANGGQVRRLTNDAYDNLAPSWSHDGQWVYFGSNRSGVWQVWKMPVAGGEPVQVTVNGGYEAVEAVDGQSIFFNKQGYWHFGLFQLSLAGGKENKVLDLPQLESFRDWAVTADGIYYIERYSQGKPAVPVSVQFFDFATRQSKLIAPLEHDPTSNPGLNIAADGRWFIYSIDDYRNFDIMLVENFH
jgi:Tol biopolymer transport system component/DNA-binding winged helix-turn-helix (wHTH) protein